VEATTTEALWNDRPGFIALNSVYWARRSSGPTSTRRAAIAELEREVTAGQDSTGHALTPNEKHRLGVIIRQRKGELDELATLDVIVPSLAFDRPLTLQLARLARGAGQG
jgi:hypothetical protein